MESIFQQTVDQYNQFNKMVQQYKKIVETDPDNLAVLGGSTSNAIESIAVSGEDKGFSLIEHTSWMIKFGQAFTNGLNALVHSQTSSTFVGPISGSKIAIYDQYNHPITESSWNSGSVTSITFTTVGYDPNGNYSYNWDVPQGCDMSQAQEQDITSNGVADPWQQPAKMTLSGDAMKAFIAQAKADGVLTFGAAFTSDLLNSFVECF